MQNEMKSPSAQPIPTPMPQDLHPSHASPTATAGQGVSSSSLQPGNRSTRRAASKKKGLPPLMPSDSRLLHQRVSQTESELQRLGNAFDQNSEVFSEGLKMLEVMGLVMQRVMNDVLAGTVRCFGDTYLDAPNTVPVRAPGPMQIDFNSYLREYWLCMLMADFATWCGTIATHDKPLIETASPADVHVFGG